MIISRADSPRTKYLLRVHRDKAKELTYEWNPDPKTPQAATEPETITSPYFSRDCGPELSLIEVHRHTDMGGKPQVRLVMGTERF